MQLMLLVQKHHDGQKRKKCRLSSAQDDVETVELIAMGTVSGHVLIYNVGKGDVERKLVGQSQWSSYIEDFRVHTDTTSTSIVTCR